MQRLYVDRMFHNHKNSMNMVRYDSPIVQYDIRSDYCSFQPLFRDDATDSAVIFIKFPFLWIVLYVSTNAR